jgi:hypothetical protein
MAGSFDRIGVSRGDHMDCPPFAVELQYGKSCRGEVSVPPSFGATHGTYELVGTGNRDPDRDRAFRIASELPGWQPLRRLRDPGASPH